MVVSSLRRLFFLSRRTSPHTSHWRKSACKFSNVHIAHIHAIWINAGKSTIYPVSGLTFYKSMSGVQSTRVHLMWSILNGGSVEKRLKTKSQSQHCINHRAAEPTALSYLGFVKTEKPGGFNGKTEHQRGGGGVGVGQLMSESTDLGFRINFSISVD